MDNKAWWSSSESRTPRIEKARNNYSFINRPGWMTVVALFLVVSAGFLTFSGLERTTQYPDGRITEFESAEYYTDVSTLNEVCTNVFAFGEPDYYGIIDKDEQLTDTSQLTQMKFLSNRLLDSLFTPLAEEIRYLTPRDYSESYYYLYPIPHHVMLVPVSGYMEDIKLSKTIYDDNEFVPVEQALRSMYDGDIVIWYNPDSPDVKRSIVNYIENSDTEVAIHAIPWLYGWEMPRQSNFAISAWNMSLNCGGWSETAVNEFLRVHDEYGYKYMPDISSPPIVEQEKGKMLYPVRNSPLDKI